MLNTPVELSGALDRLRGEQKLTLSRAVLKFRDGNFRVWYGPSGQVFGFGGVGVRDLDLRREVDPIQHLLEKDGRLKAFVSNNCRRDLTQVETL
jgi:hypothetical protein